jgi:hypothetical protein
MYDPLMDSEELDSDSARFKSKKAEVRMHKKALKKMPLKKVKEHSGDGLVPTKEDNKISKDGFKRFYVTRPETGRPNQVFECNICKARRTKIDKIKQHIQTHRDKD